MSLDQRARSLRDDERALLQFLLSGEFPGKTELREQLAHARRRDHIADPWGWILLDIDRSAAPPAPVIRKIPIEAVGATIPFFVLLFVENGYMDRVDIGRDDGVALDRLPRPEELLLVSNVS
jgi:hypothetical protein